MRRLAVLLAMSVIVLLAACGGGHKATSRSTTTATSATTPTHAPQASAETCSPQDQTMNCVLKDLPAAPKLYGLTPGQAYGVDFGWSGVTAARARQLGARFGASYLSADASKNWTRALVNDYHAAGLATVAVWETTANRSEQGFNAGASDATAAAAQAAALGNTTRPVLFAVDCDCAGGSILAYFQGAQSVLHGRVNAYGGYDQISYLHAHHAVGTENWQTYAWSGGRWLPASIAPLEQYLNGSVFDNDRSLAANYGQWPGAKPRPVVIGGAEHYERYDARYRTLAHQRMRERQTVQTWDANRCRQPVRRPVCKSTVAHLKLLRGRLLSIHASGAAWRTGSPAWIGDRNQQLWHRVEGQRLFASWQSGL